MFLMIPGVVALDWRRYPKARFEAAFDQRDWNKPEGE